MLYTASWITELVINKSSISCRGLFDRLVTLPPASLTINLPAQELKPIDGLTLIIASLLPVASQISS
jgi:hypothetical protein